MEALSFAFAIAQAADLCSHYAKVLTEAYKSYKRAETEVGDRILHVARQCHAIHVQLDLMRRIEDSLSEEHKAIQTATLEAFLGRLRNVLSKLHNLIKAPSKDAISQDTAVRVSKIRYVMFKSTLDEAIADLDRWQKDYDPSWFLMVRIASPYIDLDLEQGMSRGSGLKADDESPLASVKKIRECSEDDSVRRVKVFLPEEGLRNAHFKHIPYCSARYMQRRTSQRWLLVDSIRCSAFADPNSTLKDVRTLAARLSEIDPFRFGVLRCFGVVKHSEKNSTTLSSFDFVFEVPHPIEKEPKTLRCHLIQSTRHTLNKRFDTATQLARSVCCVHTLGFVHKNVRSDNVISFPPEGDGLSPFFLIGFDQARILERGTVLAGDTHWEKDLYRHPSRQGLKPKETYTMQHDIYSLGVCLLEIGLWRSFVDYNADADAVRDTQVLGVCGRCG